LEVLYGQLDLSFSLPKDLREVIIAATHMDTSTLLDINPFGKKKIIN
jgi:hypothetical protein